jgi:hypothetical protein
MVSRSVSATAPDGRGAAASALDTRLLTEILVNVAPPALAFADVVVVVDEFDRSNVFDHRKPELGLHAEAKRRAVGNRERVAVHLVRQHRLRIIRQFDANRAVKVSEPFL